MFICSCGYFGSDNRTHLLKGAVPETKQLGEHHVPGEQGDRHADPERSAGEQAASEHVAEEQEVALRVGRVQLLQPQRQPAAVLAAQGPQGAAAEDHQRHHGQQEQQEVAQHEQRPHARRPGRRPTHSTQLASINLSIARKADELVTKQKQCVESKKPISGLRPQ